VLIARLEYPYITPLYENPIGEVTSHHRLVQSYDAKSVNIELPNKLGAMQLLAKMCGWNEPEKHEFEHGFKETGRLDTLMPLPPYRA
jgi:hypothetical protein